MSAGISVAGGERDAGEVIFDPRDIDIRLLRGQLHGVVAVSRIGRISYLYTAACPAGSERQGCGRDEVFRSNPVFNIAYLGSRDVRNVSDVNRRIRVCVRHRVRQRVPHRRKVHATTSATLRSRKARPAYKGIRIKAAGRMQVAGTVDLDVGSAGADVQAVPRTDVSSHVQLKTRTGSADGDVTGRRHRHYSGRCSAIMGRKTYFLAIDVCRRSNICPTS